MKANKPKLDPVNIDANIQFGGILSILKIFSGNKSLASIKGQNSGTN